MRFSIHALALAIALFSLNACNIRFNDEPVAQNAKIASGACLSDLPTLADSYIDGNLEETEIKKASSCVVNALNEFNFVAKGNSFHASELVDFLNRKVMGERKISTVLTSELMKIKVLFVGGTIDFVEAEDFQQLIRFIKFLEEHALANREFIKLYRFELSNTDEQNLTAKKLDAAKEQIKKTSMALAEWLHSSGVNYDFKSLEIFIRELRRLLNFDNVSIQKDKVDNWIDLARAYKKIQVAGSDEYIEPQYWERLLQGMSELFGIYLDTKYFIISQQLSKESLFGIINKFTDVGFLQLNKLVVSVTEYVKKSIQVQKNQVLTYAMLEELLVSLQQIGVISEKIQVKKNLSPLIEHINTRAFRESSAIKPTTGITQANLQRLLFEYRVWSMGQNDLLQTREYARKNKLTEDMHKLVLLRKQQGIKVNSSVEFMLKYLPLKFTDGFTDARLQINSPYRSTILNFKDLSVMNLIKFFSRMLIRATATAPEDYENVRGVYVAEAQTLYDAVYGTLEDIGFLKQYDPNFIPKIFKEASVFSFSGRGYDESSQLYMRQITEEVAIIISGILTQAKIQEATDENRLPIDSYIQSEYAKLFKNLPELVTALKQMSDQERQDFFGVLWAISSDKCTENLSYNSSELLRFSTLLHYIESVFTTYDLNHNGQLTGQEVMRAFPRFQTVLSQEMLKRGHGKKGVGMMKSIFTYLVSRGQIPSTSSISNIVELSYWDVRYYDGDPQQYIKNPKASAPDMQIGRSEIADVFKLLSSGTQHICLQ